MRSHPQRSPDRRCKPVDEWPQSDRDLWLAAIRPGDLLEDGGALSQRSVFTIRQLATGYGRYLTWLDSRGLLDKRDSLADRITPARVRDYVASLQQDNATSTIIHRTTGLALAAKVMSPQRNWSWIYRSSASVRARHEPAKPKRHRLVGSGVLLDLGLEMITRAESEKTVRRRLITYRDGLLIALLAARPLRIRNLAGLALDRNVARRGATWWIEIPAVETKTGGRIELPWPQGLAAHLEFYLSEIRPVLAARLGRGTRPAGDALWLSTDGSPMAIRTIYERIIINTQAALGQRINPHLFRDCAATSIAIDDPAHVGIASQLLGHRRWSTTERYYNQAGALEACRQFQAFLISLRRGCKR